MKHTKVAEKYDNFDIIILKNGAEHYEFEVVPTGLRCIKGDNAKFERDYKYPYGVKKDDINKLFTLFNPELRLIVSVTDKLARLNADLAVYKAAVSVL